MSERERQGGKEREFLEKWILLLLEKTITLIQVMILLEIHVWKSCFFESPIWLMYFVLEVFEVRLCLFIVYLNLCFVVYKT